VGFCVLGEIENDGFLGWVVDVFDSGEYLKLFDDGWYVILCDDLDGFWETR
jgi:hypothetical protein